MAKRTDRTRAEHRAEIARLEHLLAERRALFERFEQRRLEAKDYPVLRALISEAIAQAEPGQESVTFELPEDAPLVGEIGEIGGTVVEDSVPESRDGEGVARRGEG
jgi:hypothetical protein